MTVNDFVTSRVLPEFRSFLKKIREVMKECVPNVTEIISYGIPAYRVHNIIAVISPTKKGITLAFSRGAENEEKLHLLKGEGKISKNIKFKKVFDINKDILCYYIQQALESDAK